METKLDLIFKTSDGNNDPADVRVGSFGITDLVKLLKIFRDNHCLENYRVWDSGSRSKVEIHHLLEGRIPGQRAAA